VTLLALAVHSVHQVLPGCVWIPMSRSMLMIRSIKWWVISPMQGGFNRPLAVERTGEKALRN
jgi:hypothetical protein